MDRSRIAIIIPALNEAATIAGVVASVGKYGMPVVVDDGSSDMTGALATAAGAAVVSHGVNRGYDAALNSGFREARKLGCDAMVTMDADGQHDDTVVPHMIEKLDAGAKMVIGTRDQQARIAEKLFGTYAQWRYGVFDPLCGMKGYSSEIYDGLGHFDSYRSIGTELMLFGLRHGFPYAQVPVRTRERTGSPRFGSLWVANRQIFRAMAIGILSDFRKPRP